MTGCLTGRAARRADGEPARTCVGEVRGGEFVPPAHAPTAGRLRGAAARLRRRLAGRCSAGALAALGACGDTPAALADCLLCGARREAALLAGSQLGGRPTRPSTGFVDWAPLWNPILGLDDRMLKDQAVVYAGGWFHLFSSTRFEADDPERATKVGSFFRTRDFRTFEPFADPDLNPPGSGPGSPDVTLIDGTWHMVFQGPSPVDPADRQLFLSTSPDLLEWTPPVPIAPDLAPDQSLIDGALARAGGYFLLGWKRRGQDTFHVTRSASPVLDGAWLPARRAFAGGEDPLITGFAENYQFVEIDGTWRLVATARDPEGFRCANIYTCSHEPFVYTIGGDPSDLDAWTRWERKTQMRVPYEAWNPVMHANSAYLADWRREDGFFYLFYAGSLDDIRFERRGHGKIGVARSRDLVHWRVAGDTRD
jgi:hypothetical protein